MNRIFQLLLLFAFINVSAQEYSPEDFKKIPEIFTNQLPSSYYQKINDGEIDLNNLNTKSKKPWTVWSDRDGNRLMNQYLGTKKSEDFELPFFEELFVLDARKNWLKVITKQKIKDRYLEGWINSRYLVLSKYSLKTEPVDGVSVPRKEIILTDLDELEQIQKSNNKRVNPEDALKLRNFYTQPKPKAEYKRGEAKAFRILFVLKEQDGSKLLSTNDVLDGNFKTNKSNALGWVTGSNVRSWNSRIALEEARSKEALDEYEDEELPGYKDLNTLKVGLNSNTFPPNPEIEFKVGEVRALKMRMPVMKRIEGNQNIAKVISISRSSQGMDDEKVLRNNELLEKLNRKKAKTNIIFAIDATISMRYYMKEVAKTVEKIIDQNKIYNSTELRFGLIVYRDYKDGKDLKAPAYKVHQLTTDYDAIKLAIQNTICESKDNDEPEAVFQGLINGLNEMNINSSESNIVVLIGDCGNHRPGTSSYNKNHSLEKVVKIFNEKSINLLSLQVNHTGDDSHFDFNDDIIDIISTTAKNKIVDDNKLKINLKKIPEINAYDLEWIRPKGINDTRDDYINMFGRFIYETDGSMNGDDLVKSVVEVVREYNDLTQDNITVLNNAINIGTGGPVEVEIAEPTEGLILYIQNTYNYSREEAKDYLNRNEVTLSAYVSMDYSGGNNIKALKEVVFLSDKEKKSLTRSLRKLSSSDCGSIKEQKKCFQDNMIEVCRSLLGYETSLETIENLSMNQVWTNLFGVEFKNEKLKNIPLKTINGITRKDFQKFYSDFKSKAISFCNNTYVHDNSYKSRRFSLNNSYYYWIPLEDLPGTIE